MLLAAPVILSSLALAAPAPQESLRAPRLDVRAGRVRVFAQEAWLTLPPGAVLPDARARTKLSLDELSRARLTIDGASVELCGPLEVDSELRGAWTVRVAGAGRVQLDVRSAPLRVELASTAGLEPGNGIYWAESIPAGGWRVGCDGGEPLVLRPPTGSGWSASPRVASGSSLRVLPAQTQPTSMPAAVRRPAYPPWRSFSWPWLDAAD